MKCEGATLVQHQMIISRYLTREVLVAFLAATLILLLVFLSEQFISYLRSAAGGRVAFQTVLTLVSLQTPVLLAMLLPLSLFLGVLLSYGRLYADSEMVVMSACGLSKARLFIITGIFAVLIAFIVALLSFWIAPQAEDYSAKLFSRDEAAAIDIFKPGGFNVIEQGKWIFYIGGVDDKSGKLKDVFAAEEPLEDLHANAAAKRMGVQVMVAKGGYKKVDPVTRENFIVLENGNRYAGVPGQKDYRMVNFAEYGIRLLGQSPKDQHAVENGLSTLQLWAGREQPPFAAELNWRLALPISAFVLALLAVPMSRVQVRRGRYLQIVPAILLYVVYANLMFLGRAWLKKGVVAPHFGMWWAHAIMFVIIFGLIVAQIGGRRLMFGLKKMVAIQRRIG